MLKGRSAAVLAVLFVVFASAPTSSPAQGVDAPERGGPAASSNLDAHAEPREAAARQDRGRSIARMLTGAKSAAALAALGLVTLAHRRRRRGHGRTGRFEKRYAGALLAVALFAFASSYNFFQWRHDHGFHVHEFFHYYLGAKYFPELGYHDLYECAAAAATEGHPDEAGRPVEIRDLRHVERRIQVIPARSLDACRGHFTPDRWETFRHDTALLQRRMTPERWARVLTDQGLNASPVWLLAGRTMAEAIPAEAGALRRYARLDLLILGIGFAAVGLAFGIEGFSLALLAWAANPLSGYGWVGDTPLRQLWFGTLLVGLSLLRRRRYGASAIFLAGSSLLRLFPIFFPIGYAARQGRRWLAERRFDPGFLHFVTIGTAAGLLLIAMSIPIAGRGVGVIGEFAAEMSSYTTLTGSNSMGWRALLTRPESETPPRLVGGELKVVEADRIAHGQRAFASRWPIYWLGVALTGILFWHALARAEDWEAACLGFVLVLVLTQAASYYMTCTVGAALLGTRRARIAMGLLATLVVWGAISLGFGDSEDGFALATVVALLLSVFTLVEMRSPADEDAFGGGPGAVARSTWGRRGQGSGQRSEPASGHEALDPDAT